jgi:hypothetical protein
MHLLGLLPLAREWVRLFVDYLATKKVIAPVLGDRSGYWDKFLTQEFAASYHRRAEKLDALLRKLITGL